MLIFIQGLLLCLRSDYRIQIHLMLIFIVNYFSAILLSKNSNTSHVNLYPILKRSNLSKSRYSNTSHVNLYPEGVPREKVHGLIQIHLMLIFIQT